MTTGLATAVALTFVWLGMVLAISFLEAPLKFRAPGITIPLGLGIGRLVFRALNIVELLLAAGIIVALLLADAATDAWLASGATILVLLVQVAVVRPALTRRTNLVLAGEDAPGSKGHLAYIGLEVVKAVGLVVTGIVLLGA
ncbi:hypothetical protein [Nocardioides sp. AE5]|uniref:hypothetical protein n=1 Tax=Nocardioides sp. AE5 TaxID=2962573 RepID=UPI002881488C|nr:hypothetical protein [Nocardioides sp. AE5]MDT0203762.1 hypothetical protein [Nocardioides sp. AE5]